MTPERIIVLATPVFLALIALEYVVGRARGRDTYRVNDATTSIGLGMLHELAAFLFRAVYAFAYVPIWQHLSVTKLDASSPWVWAGAFLLYDFIYYWYHRGGHRVAAMWASHVVHHQSEDYNLSTALRQPATHWIFGWIFFLPMALLGIPPYVAGAVALVNLLYQYWVHTQQIGKLGWFDRVFSSPSNHRVHHAVNERYLDRNYGGVLIMWDRLFGTFAEERDDEPCVYGTRAPLRSFDPLWANVEVYAALARDSWRARSWADKLRVWWKPPGWRPDDVAARFPKPSFDVRAVQYYDPPASAGVRAAAVMLWAGALLASAWWLWNARALPPGSLAAGALAIVLMLAVAGRLLQRGSLQSARSSGAPERSPA
jgi:sterol desaturase/sphingolipid hydroxylase (fatty acid hydroxylase superfamily)